MTTAFISHVSDVESIEKVSHRHNTVQCAKSLNDCISGANLHDCASILIVDDRYPNFRRVIIPQRIFPESRAGETAARCLGTSIKRVAVLFTFRNEVCHLVACRGSADTRFKPSVSSKTHVLDISHVVVSV